MNAGDVATPLASVFTDAVVPPPANVPLAPLAGAVNVTDTLGTALPAESWTVALNAAANAEPTKTLCAAPAVAVIDAAAPGLLVKENEAAVATPETLAVTL